MAGFLLCKHPTMSGTPFDIPHHFFWGWGDNWLIDRDTLLTTHKNTQNTKMSLQESSAAALVLQLFRRHAKRYCRYGRACNAVDV
ncbi:hypothetical protein KM92DES2_10659 [uncultured Desulfovibrio sp.]|uniref:Uncharacterized protein n=1 Tax=uncultured Desulfovibrio sp. TaxID=167968 RepID=A0A212J881_9BACT|nr:hypothetical protein KM92DES2_10659 [uncultured Desulfovibrio sp.]